MSRHSRRGLALTAITLLAACEENAPSNVAPSASFAVHCEPLECTFTNGSHDSDGAIESYSWDFGDESDPVSTRDAAHRYRAPGGRFTVTLNVTDDDGASTTAALPVEVENANAAPSVDFLVVCAGLACDFSDHSVDLGGSVTSYAWTFGDNGTSTGPNPHHEYLDAGPYTVQLTVTDDGGATGSVTRLIQVGGESGTPTADFTFSCAVLTCAFRDESTDTGDGGSVVTRAWLFGDGATSTEVNPQHHYAAPGTYTVRLTVADDLANVATVTRPVTVSTDDAAPLSAAFTVGCFALECTFHDFSAGGALVAWEWHFGDGSTSTDQHPTHFYDVVGPTAFTVTLTVTSADLARDVSSQVIQVTPNPVAGEWTAEAQLPEARHRVGAASLDGIVYVAGGEVAGAPEEGGSRDILAYDPGTNAWRTAGALLLPVAGPGTAALDGRIYVVGGSPEGALQIFDPATGEVEQGPALPGLGQVTAMEVDGRLHVIGIFSEPGDIFCDFCHLVHRVFDPSSGTWSSRAAPAALGLATFGAAIDGRIYLVEWYGEGRLHVYDPATDSWTISFGAPRGRPGSVAVALDGMMYLVGGAELESSAASTRIDRYDPRTSSWQPVTPLPSPRMGHGVAAVGRSIHVVGGMPTTGGTGFKDTNFRLTPE